MSDWDYIVVGAGSSGSVIASRLSEDPDTRVLLVEAGGSDRSPIILSPAATDVYAIGRPRYDWCFMAEPDPSLGGRTDMWPRGKVLGGSSSINGTIYIRGQAADFDGWAAEGATGWSYRDVLPYFKLAETNDGGASEYRGGDGPLSVQALRDVHPLTRRFVDAAITSGIPFNPDSSGVAQDGVGYNQATQRRGWRHSAARAYLHPHRKRSNLTIITHAQVKRVVIEAQRAVGIEYVRAGQTRMTRAAREVILSAGAIGSPHLLMLSGIGPAADLRDMGVEVVRDSPQVGANLQEHPGAWLTFHMRERTLNNEKGLLRQGMHGLNWLLFGRGPATTAGAQAVAFVKSAPTENTPDIQLHFTPVGYKFLPSEVVLYDEPTISLCPNVCRPKSRGHIRLRSADPLDAPKIEMALLGEADDVRVLTAGCRIARDIMAQSPIAEQVLEESAPGRTVQSDDEWEAYLRETAVPLYHPVGTCRMGSDPASVLDPMLRVRGIDGLRVADASIMPVITSGNTNAPAIMIGEKAADLISGRNRNGVS